MTVASYTSVTYSGSSVLTPGMTNRHTPPRCGTLLGAGGLGAACWQAALSRIKPPHAAASRAHHTPRREGRDR